MSLIHDPTRPPTTSRRQVIVRVLTRALTVVLLTGALCALAGLGARADATPAFADCKAAPEPDIPGSGLVGVIDPAPLGLGQPGSVYAEVGYAGLIWNTYDLGCGIGPLTDPTIEVSTWLGNQAFNLAKAIVATVCWLHYQLDAQGASFFTPLDALMRSAATAMWQSVFLRWIGLGLLATAITLLIHAGQGDTARSTRLVCTATVALAAAAAAYLNPIASTQALDSIVMDTAAQIQQGFLEQLHLGDQDTLPTVLTDTVIYQNWLRGEFGTNTGPLGDRFGRDLLRAQAFTKTETAQSATIDAQTTDAKKAQFTQIASQLGPAYPYFQGKRGSRIGIGLLAVLEALCLAVFQLVAQVMLIAGLLIVRLLIVMVPALAVIGVVQPGVMSGLVKVGGTAIATSLGTAVAAGVHSLMVIGLFRPNSGVPLPAALLVCLIVTVGMWLIVRPVKRLMLIARRVGEQSGMPHEHDRIGWRTRRALRRNNRGHRRRGHGRHDDWRGERWWRHNDPGDDPDDTDYDDLEAPGDFEPDDDAEDRDDRPGLPGGLRSTRTPRALTTNLTPAPAPVSDPPPPGPDTPRVRVEATILRPNVRDPRPTRAALTSDRTALTTGRETAPPRSTTPTDLEPPTGGSDTRTRHRSDPAEPHGPLARRPSTAVQLYDPGQAAMVTRWDHAELDQPPGPRATDPDGRPIYDLIWDPDADRFRPGGPA